MKRVAFEEVEYVPADLQGIHERLLNWARWQWSSARGSVQLGSAETRYRSPQCWHPVTPSIPVDLLDAVEVEKSLRLIPLAPWRAMLKNHYVLRLPADRCCRMLGVRFAEYGMQLNRARIMARNVLRTRDKSTVSA